MSAMIWNFNNRWIAIIFDFSELSASTAFLLNRHLIPTLDSDHTLRQIQEPLFPPKIGKKRAIFAQIDDHSSQQSACVQVRVSQLFLELRRVVVGWWAGGQRVANFVHKSAQAVYICILHTEADAVQFQAQHENLQRRPRHWRHSRSRLPCNWSTVVCCKNLAKDYCC